MKSLLDIGPNAEGEIIAPEMNNLLDAGAWLKYSGECVYDTVRSAGSASPSQIDDSSL